MYIDVISSSFIILNDKYFELFRPLPFIDRIHLTNAGLHYKYLQTISLCRDITSKYMFITNKYKALIE